MTEALNTRCLEATRSAKKLGDEYQTGAVSRADGIKRAEVIIQELRTCCVQLQSAIDADLSEDWTPDMECLASTQLVETEARKFRDHLNQEICRSN